VVSFFRDRSAVAVFWLIIICFGLHINSLLNTPQIITEPADGFFYYLVQPFQSTGAYFTSLVYVVFIFLLALQLNFMLNILRMLPKPSYTPALAFILFSALMPSLNVITPALFACNFFIWILYRACKLYGAPKPKTAIYNFGLLNGVCIVLYYPSLLLVLVAMLALMIMRPFRINEWFVLFFGLITPAYILGGYLFLSGDLKLIPQPRQLFELIRLPLQPVNIIVSLSVAVFAILWSIFSVQNAGGNTLIQVRKSWTVFLVALVFTIPVIFFVKDAFPAALLLALVPAASYTGYAFAIKKNILPVIFFWLLLGLAIYNNWFAKY
jgi:hypothetical protein